MQKRKLISAVKIMKPPKSPSKFKTTLLEVFCEYLSNSTIHGVKYTLEAKTWTEKLWWFATLIISVVFCTILIRKTLIRWYESPVLLTFSTKQVPLYTIPFPAVTICPLAKIDPARYNYSYYYNKRYKLKGKERKMFSDVSLICEPLKNTTDLHDKFTNEEAIENIIKVSPNLSETLMFGEFNGLDMENDEINYFTCQVTGQGLCFTFNALGKNEIFTDNVVNGPWYIPHNVTNKLTGWNIEEGYLSDYDEYPIRTAISGSSGGLELMLLSNRFEEYLCGKPLSGFKVILHNPAEIPTVSQNFVMAHVNKHVSVVASPVVVTSSKGLIDISLNKRICYFNQEKKLRFFQMYTQNNCNAECLVNVTVAHCNCTYLGLPRDKDMNLCGPGSIPCAEEAFAYFIEYERTLGANGIEDINKSLEFQVYQECNCFPPCASIDYNSESSYTTYHYREFYAKVDSNIPSSVEITSIKIYFKEAQFLPLHRSELYGMTEILANIGGLLGLFLGFSVLSVLELIYYITVRLCCKIREQKRVNARQLFLVNQIKSKK